MRFHKRAIRSSGACVLLSLLSSGVHAQIIAQWNFTGNVATPSFIAPGVSASPVANVALSTFTITANALAATPNASANNTNSAVSTNSYFDFTVTPNAGVGFNFTSFSLDAGGGGNASFFVRSSIDSFTTSIGGQTNVPALLPYSYSMAAPQYQGVVAPVTFRVYSFSASNSVINYDTLSLNGATIPEPATASLVLLGIMGFCGVQRRRKR